MSKDLKAIHNMRTILLLTFCLLSAQLLSAIELRVQPHDAGDANLSWSWHLTGAEAYSTSAKLHLPDGTELDASTLLAAHERLGACYLLLVDSSKSMLREQGWQRAQAIIQQLIATKPERHYLGLGQFARNLLISLAPDTNASKLSAAAANIQAQGQQTALFQSIAEAADGLADCPGYRKLLLVISDGDAEDIGIEADDTINAALQAGVSIHAAGVIDSMDSQHLLNLSQGSGGSFEQINTTVDANWSADFYRRSDNGGLISFDLEQIAPHIRTLELQVSASNGSTYSAQLDLPERQLPFWYELPLAWAPNSDPRAILLGLALAISALTIIGWLLARNSKKRRLELAQAEQERLAQAQAKPEPAPAPAIAWLVADSKNYPVTSSSTTIGRSAANVITIANETISRNQAIIDYKDGSFYITDRQSVNGTMVNGNLVTKAQLKPGDSVQFGDWQGVFLLSVPE